MESTAKGNSAGALSQNEPKDCFSCKMLSSTSLLCASAYVFTHALRAKFLPKRIFSSLFGASLGYTGLARFLDLPPFSINETPQQSLQGSTS